MNPPSFCRRCGNQLFEQGNFCPSCGAPLEPEQPSPAEAASVSGEAVQPEPASPVVPETFAPPVQAAEPEGAGFPAVGASDDTTQAIFTPSSADATQAFFTPSPAVDNTQTFSAPPYAGDATQAYSAPPYAGDATQAYSAPPYAEPAETPIRRKPPRERKKVGALRVIGASFLCLFAVLFGLSACLILVLRSATSPDALKGILEDVRISDLTIPADDGNTQKLSEYIEEQIPEKYRSDPKYQLTSGNIEKLLNKAFIRDFLESRLVEITENVYSGGDEKFLTASQVKKFLRKNADKIYDSTGYMLTDKDYDQISSYLEKNDVMENVAINELSMPRLQEELPFLSMIPFLTSYLTAGLLAFLAIAMLVLAALICRFRGFSLVYVSITCLLTGGVYLAVALLTNTLASALHDLSPLQRAFYLQVLSPVRSACYRIGLPLVGIGLFCILLLVVAKLIRNANAKKNPPPADIAY